MKYLFFVTRIMICVFVLIFEVSAGSFTDKVSKKMKKVKGAVKEKFDEVKSDVSSEFKDAKYSIENKVKIVRDEIVSEAEETKEKIDNKLLEIKEKAEDIFEKTKDSFEEVMKVSKTMFIKDSVRNFCPIVPDRKYAPTIEDPSVIKKDTEGMIPIIKKYSPVLYLFNEKYYPCAVEDYFLDSKTQLIYELEDGKREVVIPQGEITMEKIYENRTKYSGRKYFFAADGNTIYGSNPKRFSDDNGNLTTPIYVNWSLQDEKIYIVYVFAYAFNGAYPIAAPVVDIRMFQDGAHEFDLEHIVLELDAKSKTLERIFFATHTSREGVWLSADHKDIVYEGSTHPVVHVARNGHGSYPRAGTHVRIFGFANDITSRTYKSHRWTPQIVLIYPETDDRFDKKTMGWAYHSGVYGGGVDPYKRFIGANAKGKGQPYESVQFCKNPEDPRDRSQWLKYRFCVEKKRVRATVR